MEILEHVLAAQDATRSNTRVAMRMMAEDVLSFLSDDAVLESFLDENLAELFLLPLGLVEDAATATAKAKRWGDEAEFYSKRADRIHRMKMASPHIKAAAHSEAHKAHDAASILYHKAGDTHTSAHHQRRAGHHKAELDTLAQKHGLEVEDFQADTFAAQTHAHMANWRAQQLKKKLAAKRTGAAPLPLKQSRTENIENYLGDLDEGDYHPDVKQASKIAADATKRTKEPSATPDHHETAARLHFIAQGVALAHRHHELAAKHAEFVDKHRTAARKARVA